MIKSGNFLKKLRWAAYTYMTSHYKGGWGVKRNDLRQRGEGVHENVLAN